MIGSGRSYVVVGSCDVFFPDQVLYVYGLGYTGLGRARQGLDLGCGGPGKKIRGDKNTPPKLG